MTQQKEAEIKKRLKEKKEMYSRAVDLKRQSRFRFFQEIEILKAELKGIQEARKEMVEKIKEIRSELADATIKYDKGYGNIGDLRTILLKLDRIYFGEETLKKEVEKE